MSDHDVTKVAVVGGGVAGLATARHVVDGARERGLDADVTVFEADTAPGGNLRTIRDGDWQLEWGPNGFLDNEPATLRLVDRAGLDDALLRSSDAARLRFLLSGGKLHMLPMSPPAFIKTGLLSPAAKLRVAGELFVKPRRGGPDPADDPAADETVYDFGVRRLGREFAESFLDPMVKGIFGGDARELSLAAAFPRMVELERDHGGLFRAMAAISRAKKKAADAGPGGVLHSFRGGMTSLVDALAAGLDAEPNARVLTGAPVSALRREGEAWYVSTPDGEQGPFAAVVDASPAHAAAAHAPDAHLAELLGGIPYVPMAVITLGFARDDVGHDLNGFGHLIPTREGCRLLGALWTSSIFTDRAPDGRVLIRAMAGGPRDTGILDLDDDAMTAMAVDELRPVLDLQGAPERAWVIRHPRAIAQYRPGHMARLKALDAALTDQPGLVLTGSSYRGVAVNYCAKEAETAAAQVLDRLQAPLRVVQGGK